MLTSVIIVTRNRAELLTRCLTALVEQTVLPDTFEVIVVDDGSQDDTRSACHLMSKKIPNLCYLSTERHIGLSAARNLGIQQAKGQYLIFTDDDCIAAADWLAQMKKALGEKPVIAGAVTTSYTHFLTMCHNVAQFHQFMPGSQQGPSAFIAGANMGFRRSVLDRLGGFRKTGFAGDSELILRARQKGYTIWFVPKANQKYMIYNESLRVHEDVELVSRIKRQGKEVIFVPDILVFHDRDTTFTSFIRRNFRMARTSRTLGFHRLAHLCLEAFLLSIFFIFVPSIWLTELRLVSFSVMGLYSLILSTIAITGAWQTRRLGVLASAPLLLLSLHLARGVGSIFPEYKKTEQDPSLLNVEYQPQKNPMLIEFHKKPFCIPLPRKGRRVFP